PGACKAYRRAASWRQGRTWTHIKRSGMERPLGAHAVEFSKTVAPQAPEGVPPGKRHALGSPERLSSVAHRSRLRKATSGPPWLSQRLLTLAVGTPPTSLSGLVDAHPAEV